MRKKGKCLISIIAAVARNRVIGLNNKLPWNLPADMEHFRKLTLGKPVIMGQKTFESIGRPLAGRTNIILTKDKNYRQPKCIVVYSVEEALDAVKEHKEAMVIGGASIYSQFLPLANKMYLTLIHQDFEGDVYFPEFDHNDWQETERIDNLSDKNNPYNYSFIVLERKNIRTSSPAGSENLDSSLTGSEL